MTATAPPNPLPLAPPPIAGNGPTVRTAWPAVIGVLSMVLGASDLLIEADFFNLYYLVRVKLATVPGPSFVVLPSVALGQIAVASLANLLLIVSGMLLLLRRRAGMYLHLIWVPLAILTALSSPFVAWLTIREEFRIFTALRAAFRCPVMVAYPIFILIWFARAKVRRHMQLWRTGAERAATKPLGRTWPTVLGAVAIVLGARYLLIGVPSIVIWIVWSIRNQDQMNPLLGPWLTIGLRLALEALALARTVLLIVSGRLLLRRRREGATCCVIYALMAGILVAFALGMRILSLRRFLPALDLRLGLIMLLQQLSVALPSLAFAVFLLIWFHRRRIRQEVRSWPRPRQ